MSHLGRGIDEFEVDLFQGGAFCVDQQRFTQRDDTILVTDATTLEHHEIVIDLSVVWETAHRGDCLLG